MLIATLSSSTNAYGSHNILSITTGTSKEKPKGWTLRDKAVNNQVSSLNFTVSSVEGRHAGVSRGYHIYHVHPTPV
jgi:hypothetical protein